MHHFLPYFLGVAGNVPTGLSALHSWHLSHRWHRCPQASSWSLLLSLVIFLLLEVSQICTFSTAAPPSAISCTPVSVSGPWAASVFNPHFKKKFSLKCFPRILTLAGLPPWRCHLSITSWLSLPWFQILHASFHLIHFAWHLMPGKDTPWSFLLPCSK